MGAPHGVAVFGSSEPAPGDPLYELAREMGRSIARAGHVVVTGGYGGVMEGASRGAVEAGGGALGVTCRIFDHRGANPYLTEEQPTADLHERTQRLIERSRAYVILSGKSGTLAELAFLWALHRAGCLADKPVVLLGNCWTPFLDFLRNEGMLEAAQMEITQVAADPAEAMRALRPFLDTGGAGS